MRTFDRALRCLKHPATVASIALLVVNDHIFKVLAPSLFLLLTLSFTNKSTVKASAGVTCCAWLDCARHRASALAQMMRRANFQICPTLSKELFMGARARHDG
jgi:hypothetical protein